MQTPRIFRRRYIPDEIVDISGDTVIHRDERLLVTKWKAIHPRKDLGSGISWAFLKEGYKIARFYSPEGKFLYWYVDIIDVHHEVLTDTYTFVDLLVDVRLYPDGTLQVLDADELADALEQGLITPAQTAASLRRLDKVLGMLRDGAFPPAPCREIGGIEA